MFKAVYADPPYMGQAKKHYGTEEIDYGKLIKAIVKFDAWALSCSSPSLRVLLPLCPVNTRVAAWVKPFASFKPGINPAYAWEPILYHTNKQRDRTELTVRDWVSANITLRKGLVGAKPEMLCHWIFRILGLTPNDCFIDLFPGTGIVSQCWNDFCIKEKKE
jgi:hypothetical protein